MHGSDLDRTDNYSLPANLEKTKFAGVFSTIIRHHLHLYSI
jgi:hypothetical protein